MHSNLKLFSQSREIFPPGQTYSCNGRNCQRDKPFKATPLNAMKFLMLREHGETFRDAIHFSTRRFCRYDSTQIKDGTKNFRIFKRKPKEQKYTNYGWVTHGEPEVLTQLPDITDILREGPAQDKLISSIINTNFDLKSPSRF